MLLSQTPSLTPKRFRRATGWGRASTFFEASLPSGARAPAERRFRLAAAPGRPQRLLAAEPQTQGQHQQIRDPHREQPTKVSTRPLAGWLEGSSVGLVPLYIANVAGCRVAEVAVFWFSERRSWHGAAVS